MLKTWDLPIFPTWFKSRGNPLTGMHDNVRARDFSPCFFRTDTGSHKNRPFIGPK